VLFAAADAVAGFGEEAVLPRSRDRRANHFAFAGQPSSPQARIRRTRPILNAWFEGATSVPRCT
jgi:hypothetical protein